MKKYEYVTVDSDKFQYTGMSVKKKIPHRTIIDEYAKKGYSYVGFLPIKTTDTYMCVFDLIFEKEVRDESEDF